MSLVSRSCLDRVLTVLALLAALALSPSAGATHKIDHRYTVWGEITYADGAPASGVTIKLSVKDGAVLGETKTDERGRYRVLLHVHNEDLYKVFDMQVADVKRKVRILFNPADRSTERGQRVDLSIERDS